MNEQNTGERSIPWSIVERTEKDTNSPVANSDPLADEVPVEAAPIHEAPMGETVAAVGPMDETIVQSNEVLQPQWPSDYPRSPCRHECRIIGGSA